VRGALVGEWALGSETLAMKQLIWSLGMIGNGLPSMKEILAWTVPNALIFGKASCQKNYNLVHLVPVDCRCTLSTRFNKLSRKLRLKLMDRKNLRQINLTQLQVSWHLHLVILCLRESLNALLW
jgi:hypothetical protein